MPTPTSQSLLRKNLSTIALLSEPLPSRIALAFLPGAAHRLEHLMATDPRGEEWPPVLAVVGDDVAVAVPRQAVGNHERLPSPH
jgi:hypothetical protein